MLLWEDNNINNMLQYKIKSLYDYNFSQRSTSWENIISRIKQINYCSLKLDGKFFYMERIKDEFHLSK